MKRSVLPLVAAALFLPAIARAQFTSAYPYVALAANFNGYDTYTTNMILISNGVWQSYQPLSVYSNPAFLFALKDFTTTWKENPQTNFSLPLLGTAELNAGNDIAITGNISGTLRFNFDEISRNYSVFDVTFGGAGNTEPWINEFHYDNTNTDADEGVEIAGLAGTVLTNYTIYLYNGNGGGTYSPTTPLTGTLTNQSGGYGMKFFPIVGIQNGAPDGLALVKGSNTVIQFISYEGGMTAVGGPADGMAAQDIIVVEDAATPVGHSLQLTGSGGSYGSFTWLSPTNHTRNLPNLGQTFVTAPSPVSVNISNLTHSPSEPLTNDNVSIQADIFPSNGASNISATTFYRVGTNGLFRPLAMTNVGTHYATASNVPAQVSGSIVSYYVFVNHRGPGTNSPTLFPSTAPSNVPSYGVSAVAAGSVWINEFNAFTPVLAPNEFIEFAGPAGVSLQNWTLQLYDETTNNYANYVFASNVVFANDSAGFGFYVLGDSNGVVTVDQQFSHASGPQGYLTESGAMRLLDNVGLVQHGIRYGYSNEINNPITMVLPGTTYVGEEGEFFAAFFDDFVLALTGTGGNRSAFTWVTNMFPNWSPGAVNSNQTLTGGNTNPLPPVIICPPDVFLTCTNSPIPPPDTNAVGVVNLCSSGTVVVTHISDSTNSGTGCFSGPKIITRRYRAVSPSCNTTSECIQTITILQTTAPMLTYPTQTLNNAGFEFGDFAGWQLTSISNNATVNSAQPKQGFFNARMSSPYNPILRDATENAFDGRYVGARTQQSGATGSTGTSALFDGTNDYATAPAISLDDSIFSIVTWLQRNGQQTSSAGIVFSRAGNTVAGLHFGTNNELRYTWNDAGNTFDSGLTPSNNAWTFTALVISPTNAVIYMRDSIQMWSATNIIANAAEEFDGELNLGRDPLSGSNRYFKGMLDDVQIYRTNLDATAISALYNAGSGGATSANLLAHYRLDENYTSFTSNITSFQQDQVASSGQTWQASIFALMASQTPLAGSNDVRVALQFLNATGGVVGGATSPALNKNSPSNQYVRLTARGIAPSNTIASRIRVEYTQDADLSGGLVYLDEAVLSPFVITSGLNCAIMPDFTPLVSAVGACSTNAITPTQFPAIGSSLGATNVTVTFTASDGCSAPAQGSIIAIVDDVLPPSATYATNLYFSCSNSVPAASTNAIAASDNCGPAFVTYLGETNNSGTGCPGSTSVIVRTYLVSDISGNSTTLVQTITVVDTNPPVMNCSAPALTNAGFETGTFSSWATFGPNVFNEAFLPRTGSRHAKLFGNLGDTNFNYAGFYQDLTATNGQVWRSSAFLLTATNDTLQGGNWVEVKLEFLDNSQAFVGNASAPIFTTNSPVGVYVPISVTATTPPTASKARCTVIFVEAPGAAAGSVYIDDASLSLTTLSASPTNCGGRMTPITSLAVASDCGNVTVTQSVASGSSITGTNLVNLVATDHCGLSSTCIVSMVVVDDVAPVITTCALDLNVQTTNDVPAPDTNAVVATDNCGSVSVTHFRDTRNNGTGLLGDPLIIMRYYKAADLAGNPALCRQTITVEATIPTAPTNVTVSSITMGTNITVRSTGTNTWSVLPEYVTNLIGAQNWLPITNVGNSFLNGTNTTTFGLPVSNAPVYIRVKQTYP